MVIYQLWGKEFLYEETNKLLTEVRFGRVLKNEQDILDFLQEEVRLCEYTDTEVKKIEK